MKLVKWCLPVLIESIMLAYIVFSLISSCYSGFKWIDRDRCYYSKELTISHAVIVLAENEDTMNLNAGDVIHSNMVDRNGVVYESFYMIDGSSWVNIHEGISADCFVEEETILNDAKMLFVDKDKHIDDEISTMNLEYIVCFVISLIIMSVVMFFTKNHLRIHCLLILLLFLISMIVFYVVGLGGYNHPHYLSRFI